MAKVATMNPSTPTVGSSKTRRENTVELKLQDLEQFFNRFEELLIDDQVTLAKFIFGLAKAEQPMRSKRTSAIIPSLAISACGGTAFEHFDLNTNHLQSLHKVPIGLWSYGIVAPKRSKRSREIPWAYRLKT
jgi:hypothetical protein